MKIYRDAEERDIQSPIVKRVSAIIILFGILLLCFIWVDFYYKIQYERQREEEAAFKETANLARAFEEHTLRTIKSVDQTVLFLKYERETAGRDFDIYQYTNKGQFATPPIILLSIIDENGNLAAASQPFFEPTSLKDRKHFLVHKDFDSSQLFISKPVFGRVSGKWSIQMTRRVNKSDGSFAGVIVASVDPYYFTEFYKQVDIGENSSISLIGLDGVLRARETNRIAQIGQKIEDSALLKHLKYSKIGQYREVSPVDGIKRFYSYRSLKGYPFIVLVGMDEEEAFRDLNQRVSGYYWIAGIASAAIVVFIVILLLSAKHRRRIEKKLKEARDGLELKVRQRTEELFSMNEELTAMNEKLQHTNRKLSKENIERKRAERSLEQVREHLLQKNEELLFALNTIEQTQTRMIQQEKLAGIGQLAAGVAHEINNPLGFVIGNTEILEEYFRVFVSALTQYRELCNSCNLESENFSKQLARILQWEKAQDITYILNDLPELFQDTFDGLERMNRIVKGMRMLAHADRHRVFAPYDLNDGLKSTLAVAHNEIKNHAMVEKKLGDLPSIEAVGSEINQVLLNLIINAVQAVKEKNGVTAKIAISTWQEGDFVYLAVEDSGQGITADNLKNIFNPFFTTKPVGKGTGLGLSISYDIVVHGHNGEILVDSTWGKGTALTLKLPVKQPGDS